MTLPGIEPARRMSVEFFVSGAPHGKDFTIIRFGKGEKAFTSLSADNASVQYMKRIEAEALAARDTFSDWDVPDNTVPVCVEVEIRLAIAKSWPERLKGMRLGRWSTKKPDIDNVLNCVYDALMGRIPRPSKLSPGERALGRQRSRPILSEDSQVARTVVTKKWVESSDEGILVKVSTL